MASRSVFGFPMLLLFAGVLSAPLGCGPKVENHEPPKPQQILKDIENNPYMSPAQKQAALDNYRAHQQISTSIGTARQGAGKKQP